MCGIAGYLTKESFNNNLIIDKMTQAMSHRGPDAQGYELLPVEDGFLALVHTRLSIQDLSPLGNQPFVSEDKSVLLIFNGEIYNFLDLKHELTQKGYRFKSNCDTEVLLNAYLEWGIHVTDHIKGDFAFSIFDKRMNKVYLFRDPLGVKPLYYTFADNSFVFSSKIKSIFEFPGVLKEVNEEVLPEYLLNGWIYEPDTMFKGIRKLEAGHFMEYDIK